MIKKIYYKNKWLPFNKAVFIALKLINSKDFDEAYIILNKILKLDKSNHLVIFYIGEIYFQKNKFNQSIIALEKAINIYNQNSDYFFSLAKAQKQIGDYNNAIINYDKCININPTYYMAYANKANILTFIDQPINAILNYDKAIQLNPNNPLYYNNKAIAQKNLKLYEDAISSCNYSIFLDSNFSLAYYNKALIYQEIYQFNNSISLYLKSLEIDPFLINSHINIAKIYIEMNSFHLAKDHYLKILLIDKNNLAALYGLGLISQKSLIWDLAFHYFKKCIDINLEYEYALGFFINAKLNLCHWDDLDYYLELAKLNIKNLTPFIALNLFNDLNIHYHINSNYHITHNYKKLISKKEKTDKIKLGFFCSEFCFHPISIWLIEQIENSNKDKFELYGFALQNRNKDSMYFRYLNAFDHFFQVENFSDQQIVNLSLSIGIDIAIDIMGHTDSSRPNIFDIRLAPIQVNHIGFPSTSGSKNIDYIISDYNLIPIKSQNFYTEKIAYLKLPYTYDRHREILNEVVSREHYGLPLNSFIFTCQNSINKISPEIFDLWMLILKESPNSVLWLQESNTFAKTNLLDRALKLGINNDRLFFTKRDIVSSEYEYKRISRYLNSYKLADLFLDTFPYNAGTTAFDALYSGLPILTKSGDTIVSRLAASALEAIEMSELITHSNDQYKALAISLSLNPNRIKDIKVKLNSNIKTSKIFDTVENCKEYDRIYQVMYNNNLNNLPCENIF
jgi:predicted O-linked N-acetylglucosamine transferase (SPINDLY family)